MMRMARATGRVRRLSCIVALGAGAASWAACVGDEPVLPAVGTPGGGPDSGGGALEDVGTEPIPRGDGGVPDASDRLCANRAPAAGVTDFLCADFDGDDVAEGFTTPVIPDAGALERSTSFAFSPPASLVTKGGAHLVWEHTRANPFSEIDARFRVLVGDLPGVPPPSSGSLALVELSSVQTSLSLRYTRAGLVDGAEYTGYYLQAVSCPTACVRAELPLPPLAHNLWVDVRIVWASTGSVRVTYGDQEVLSGTALSSTSTLVRAVVGLRGDHDPPATGSHNFDDVLVSVRRD